MALEMKPSRYWYRLGYWLFGLFLFFFYSYRFFHRQRVPPTGPILIIANHESYWDPPIVGCAVGRQVTYMARKTLFNSPALAWWMNKVGAFPVDQEGTGLDGLKKALQLLKEGKGVIVFPEGTRTPDGRMRPFQQGIALLIRRAKVPVLPIGLAGSYDAWAIHQKKPAFAPLWCTPRKASIACVIGEVIPAESLLSLSPDRMMAYLSERVAKLRAEAYQRKRLPAVAI
jgi:1-acyl-sn-glycerol-3-phosphate acyltransferase